MSFLVAVDRNLVIGDDRGIPWHLPADLKRFRKLTLGKPIIMGRTTFEHIGRPLDQRLNIVLSRREGYSPEGVTVARSMDEAIRLAGDVPEVVVIGGGEVYAAVIDRVNRLHLTVVEGAFAGTAYFPATLPASAGMGWKVVHRERHAEDEKNPIAHQYMVADLTAGPGGPLDVRSLAVG